MLSLPVGKSYCHVLLEEGVESAEDSTLETLIYVRLYIFYEDM